MKSMRLEKLRDLYNMDGATEKELSDRAWNNAQEKIRKYKKV